MRLGFGLGLTARVAAGAAAPTIASLYGTGLGQVPLHLNPATAVLDGSNNVTGVPNSGGAAATFNAAVVGSGITRSGNLLTVNAVTAAASLAAPADLVGARLFIVLQPASTANSYRLLGHPATTVIRLNPTELVFWSSDGGITTTITGMSLIGALSLIEVEMVAGTVRAWKNAALIGTQTRAQATFPLSNIGRGNVGGLEYVGTMGDITSLIVDGSGNQSAQIAIIRQALAAKHGITLA